MARRTVLVALACIGGLAAAGGLAFARLGSEPAPVATLQARARSSAAWCGSPFGTKNGRTRRDMSDCTRLSITGTAPSCSFSAHCRDDHLSIDCASAGPGFCRCDGPSGSLVRYDPAFCAMDGGSASQSLHAILARAADACHWTSP
jgi:hypothetical protein